MSFTKYQTFTFVISSSDKLPAITRFVIVDADNLLKISCKLLNRDLVAPFASNVNNVMVFMNLGRDHELSVAMHTQHVNALTI
jgi:hypothetical protein